jgi:hypothetical protein
VIKAAASSRRRKLTASTGTILKFKSKTQKQPQIAEFKKVVDANKNQMIGGYSAKGAETVGKLTSILQKKNNEHLNVKI